MNENGFKFNIGDKVKTLLYGKRSANTEFTIIDRKYGNSNSGKVYKINSNSPYEQWVCEGWFSASP